MSLYARYPATPISGTVSATQGTSPWIVAGGGTAGTSATGVVTVQGITSGTPVPVSGSVTATNPSVSATGAAVPASATMVGGSDGTTLRALKVSAAGVLSVDGSATTQPISGTVTADAGTGTFTTNQVATSVAVFQDGAIAFGSLTTSFQTVVTAGGALVNVMLRNNTNGVIAVSLDSGSSTAYTLDPGDTVAVDLKTLGRNIATSTTLQAKYSGSAPTSGSIRINGVY